MESDIKKMWVEALRGGEYRQGMGKLRSIDGFCCLGVLCDLAAKEGVGQWEEDDGVYRFYARGRFSQASLPDPIRAWAGLESTNPFVYDPEEAPTSRNGTPLDNLADLNDSGYTFDQIAVLIEAKL